MITALIVSLAKADRDIAVLVVLYAIAATLGHSVKMWKLLWTYKYHYTASDYYLDKCARRMPNLNSQGRPIHIA